MPLGILAALALGGTTLAMAINETPSVPFGTAWAEARRIGVRSVTLSVDWAAAERAPGNYDLTFPKIAEAFYPREGVSIGLVLRDLNTNRDERPADLRTRAFDDPEALRRWSGFADAVLAAMPTAKLDWIAVGNEVDASLGTDAGKIASYGRFLRFAYTHLRNKRPGVRLGTTMTFDGVQRSSSTYRPLLQDADVAMVNYYFLDNARRTPRTQVPKDLDAMVQYAAQRPVLLTEAGAPSGAISGGSEAGQAEFVRTVAAEVRRRKIGYLNFVWMNDVGDAAVENFTKYYGYAAPAFRDFLGSLGLRHADGKPKPAWSELERALASANR